MTFNEFVIQMEIFEGFRSKVYLDAGGVKTIGFGFTDAESINKSYMTKEEATDILKNKLSSLYGAIVKKSKSYGYDFNENQLLALTSFAYNCGMGNFDKLCNYGNRTIAEIGAKIILYNKCNGKTLAGLVKRREWEQDLFLSRITSYKENITNKEIQILCNAIISTNKYNLQKLVEDGIIGNKSREVIFTLLSKLL